MKGCDHCEKDDCYYCNHIKQIYEEFKEAYVSSRRTDMPYQPVLWRIYHTRNKFNFYLKIEKAVYDETYWDK